MAVKKYFVNNGNANIGPFDMNTIVEKVNAGALKATDHICVSVDNDEWILICQHEEFLKTVEAVKPFKKPSVNSSHSSGNIGGVKPLTGIPKAPKAPVSLAKPVVEESVVVQKPVAVAEPVAAEEPRMVVSNGAAEPVQYTQTQTAANSPVPEVTSTFTGDITSGQWYVLKGKNRFGPFMYLDIIRMLQEKSVFEFDYVWSQGLDSWKRIAEVQVFSPEHIRGLFDSHEEAESKVFYRRNFPRAKYETTIIIHDNSQLWKGRTIELSEGGAGVEINNAMILPGQNLYVHFKPGALSKAFNVLCEVVSKRYVKGIKDKEAPIVYGLKFINIQKQDREAIKMIQAA